MKRFLFCVCLCLSILCTSVFAVEESTGDSSSSGSVVPSVQYVRSPDVYITNEIIDEELGEYVGTSVYSLSPVRPTDVTGLKRVMVNLIGNYDAIVVEHQYENYNGSYNYVREILPDHVWLCSCGLFVVVLFCILRGGFAVLCKL